MNKPIILKMLNDGTPYTTIKAIQLWNYIIEKVELISFNQLGKFIWAKTSKMQPLPILNYY